MERIPVKFYDNVTEEDFVENIYPKRVPAILQGVDIGDCKKKWTLDYLKSSVPATADVKVHVSSQGRLDFINKNFIYRTLKFKDFLDHASETIHKEFFISPTELYYLRSIGDDHRKDIADISKQFPQLSGDIALPTFFHPGKFFSSVFRIGSAGIQLWTHYDVMDNLLVQVTGRKRVVLYSPNQADCLYMNGDKSEVLDIDNPDPQQFPLFSQALSHECLLMPGDILFIPALWFHNVASLDFAVSVNYFWKHLDDKFYDSKDTYGNKDLKLMKDASQIIDRATKALSQLPPEYCDFYARLLSHKLRKQCLINEKT